MALTQQQIDTLIAARDATRELRDAVLTMEALWAQVQSAVLTAGPALTNWNDLKTAFSASYVSAKAGMNSNIAAWTAADQAVLDL